jgi:hypothetical protein
VDQLEIECVECLIDDLRREEARVVHVVALRRAGPTQLGSLASIELGSNVREIGSREKMGLEEIIELCGTRRDGISDR